MSLLGNIEVHRRGQQGFLGKAEPLEVPEKVQTHIIAYFTMALGTSGLQSVQ